MFVDLFNFYLFMYLNLKLASSSSYNFKYNHNTRKVEIIHKKRLVAPTQTQVGIQTKYKKTCNKKK